MTRIRKSPTMTGAFAEVAQEFIQYKRSAGFKYADEPKCLSRFCRFSEELGITEIEISRSLAENGLHQEKVNPKKAVHTVLPVLRQFAIYLNNLGYDAYIVPEVKGLNHNSFVPYIFTHEQIVSVIKAADETEPREVARNMHLALPVIFRILYGCGLRVSEVVGLRYKDVNLEDGILTIREAKTDRDRYIPLSDSVKEACISYADKIWWEKDSDFFFLAPDKTMISPMTVYQRYRRYLEVAGISHGGKGKDLVCMIFVTHLQFTFCKVDQRRSRSDCYAPDSLHIYGTQNSTLNRTVSAADSRSLSRLDEKSGKILCICHPGGMP